MKKKSDIIIVFFMLPLFLTAQVAAVTLSGSLKNRENRQALEFANIVLKRAIDSTFITGTITDDSGLFSLENVNPGEYLIEASYIGYLQYTSAIFVGSKSSYLNIGAILMDESSNELAEVLVIAKQNTVGSNMDKKTFSIEDYVSQGGGSVLQSIQALPGVTTKDGQVQLRGNSQVMILIDGKQTAITGFGGQNGLDNIPASAVDKIEIINNPSAKYDANGNAGIVNIILKKEDKSGWNGKLGLITGLGALWERQENYPGIRPQYKRTPKINPSLSLNYRQRDFNIFFQADNLYTETLNRNEFVTRTYQDGTVIKQQLKRNRDTNFFTSKGGIDWYIDDHNNLTVSGLFSQESIMDRGDQPFFNQALSENLRLWQFLEDEVLTAAMGSVAYEHLFQQPGKKLNIGFNYTFDREDEKYFFDNTLPSFTSQESFFLIADQRVFDFNIDYSKPLKNGVLETGFKFRRRTIPTDMQFNLGVNSPLDPDADGLATYKETIPALYANYTYEIKSIEMELGLRIEYVDLFYEVDPNHNTYSSDGYDYLQPFPSLRFTYNLDDHNKLSAFFNRRVDRPDEVDIRIFPKYDDAEIIKVGNPGLRPQFTNSFEVGYKNIWDLGYLYSAVYHRMSEGTITRIATTVDDSNLIYNISQNAGNSTNTGVEIVVAQDLSDRLSFNLNLNGYYNKIDAFSVFNLYPIENVFSTGDQDVFSGAVKLNSTMKWANGMEGQFSAIYYAPDILPQGTIDSRFSIDLGVKKSIQKGRGELFFSITDLLNTMVISQTIEGANFNYVSDNYYETQVVRLGYKYSL